MNIDNSEEFESSEDSIFEYQPHKVDDPNVWGLSDVARGRTPLVPTTIYNTAGDNASGVAGLLRPGEEFRPKSPTQVGTVFTAGERFSVKPVPGEPTLDYVVAWDGAKPEDEFVTEEGLVSQGSSKGLLLGAYDSKAAVRPKRADKVGVFCLSIAA